MKKVKSKKLQIFLFISALGLISIFGWLATVTTNDDTKTSVRYEILTNKKQYQHQQTKCLINNENITCVKLFDKYYIPFDFLSRKFDLQSKQEENGLIRVMFSNSKIYIPPENFDHSDEYLWFSKVNVEPRERVLYMSLKYGVPISSQWNKSGHIYPIQVAQFGLSHWSKWKSKRNSEIRTQKFLVDHKNYFIYNYNNDKNSLKSSLYGFEFNFSERAIYKSNLNFVHISAYITTKSKFHLTIDLKFNSDNTSKIGRITYYFENSTQQSQNESRRIDENNESFKIEFFLTFDFSSRRLKFSRNICVDICKSLKGSKCEQCSVKSKADEPIVRVFQIGVIGQGQIEDGLFYLDESPSLELAQLAADYLVSNQNETTGGWMIHVNRKFDNTLKLSLPNNGWYSSMAQGQAISLLCRMYSTTNNSTYLKSAQKGLNLFDIDVKNGGIRSSFVNRIDNASLWFEEYPTQPFSLYVLNGFIYTIFGLTDYVSLCDDSTTTRRILLESLRSLTTYISHYDTGTRTLYDLRHLSDAELYPNVARWDYHTLHVSQLYYLVDFIKRNSKLFILDGSDEKEISNFQIVLRKVAVRWHNYVYGVWNKESQIKFNSASE